MTKYASINTFNGLDSKKKLPIDYSNKPMNNLTAMNVGQITTPKDNQMLRIYSDFTRNDVKDEKP